MNPLESAGEPAVACSGVTKQFGEQVVLRDVDLEVARGGVVCLIGPSGSGKSTFLRCLNGLVRPDAGEATVLGVDLMRKGADLIALRRRVGMVFQQFNLFPHRKVLDNVAEGPRYVLRRSKQESGDIARRQLERVGLSDKLDAVPSRLSGGQQQRVAIARALAMDPELMLFDECTSALDPELVGEVLMVIKRLAEDGITIVMASHEMAFARDVADQIVMLDSGEVVERGASQSFFTNPGHDRTRRFLARLEWRRNE